MVCEGNITELGWCGQAVAAWQDLEDLAPKYSSLNLSTSSTDSSTRLSLSDSDVDYVIRNFFSPSKLVLKNIT